MASDDYLLEAVAGALQGFGSVYLPRKQAEFKSNLQSQRLGQQQEAELDLYKRKLPLQEASEMRINAAKPQSLYQAIDYDTGENIGYPTIARPIPLSKNQRSVQTEEEKQEARLNFKKQGLKPKAFTSLKAFNTNTDNTIRQIDELLNSKDLDSSAGFLGRQKARLQGTSAYDTRAQIESIKSAVSLDTLTALRAASPTGGALGNVSDSEGKRLENSKANIDPDQSPEKLRKSLQDLRNALEASKRNANEGYELDFGETPNFGQSKSVSTSQTGMAEPKVGQMFEGKKIRNVRRIN